MEETRIEDRILDHSGGLLLTMNQIMHFKAIGQQTWIERQYAVGGCERQGVLAPA